MSLGMKISFSIWENHRKQQWQQPELPLISCRTSRGFRDLGSKEKIENFRSKALLSHAIKHQLRWSLGLHSQRCSQFCGLPELKCSWEGQDVPEELASAGREAQRCHTAWKDTWPECPCALGGAGEPPHLSWTALLAI